MKKLLPILLLAVLFISCSSDDDNDPNNGNQNGKNMIDEKILGKWKVEYSKMIYLFAPNPIYPNDTYYKIFEYEGNYNGTKETMPQAGLFSRTDIGIEFDKQSKIKISYVAYKDANSRIVEERIATTNYKISNDSIYVEMNTSVFAGFKYNLNSKGELIIGFTHKIPEGLPSYNSEYLPQRENYLYSKYSKITE